MHDAAAGDEAFPDRPPAPPEPTYAARTRSLPARRGGCALTLVMTVVVALVYLTAAAAARARGRSHSHGSTLAFVAGLAVLAFALREQWGPYDDQTPWVHDAQHTLVMSIAPPLLALGAPFTLAVQVLPTRWARRLVALLHGRPLRALCGQSAALHVPFEYYGVMALYLVPPVRAFTEAHQTAHAATHATFLVCGLMFWVPLVGADPVGWRPGRRTGLLLVALGAPIGAALAAATGSWSLLGTTQLATALGVTLVAVLPRRVPPVRVPSQRRSPPLAATSVSAVGGAP
jgi:cytochrome c oxidase assembly factor CtaG